MPTLPITLQRLAQQRLVGNSLDSPEEVVTWLGAVQAQEYPGAKWSLGMRLHGLDEAAVDQAFNKGKILRTHVLRPTWHFVTPVDIRWLLELTGPRVKLKMAHYDRQLGIEEGHIAHSRIALAQALSGGKHLTRLELRQALEGAGIPAVEQRLGNFLIHAELDGVVCSGALRGKQHTYALLDECAPQTKRLRRDEALALLARRYFTGHGPATLRDFAWWSGLTQADGRTALELCAAELEQAVVDGQVYWSAVGSSPPAGVDQANFLLPTYDEILVGYEGFGHARSVGLAEREAGAFQAMIMVAGRIAGSWKRTARKDRVTIEIRPFSPLTPEAIDVVEAAARRYGEFLGRLVEVIH